MPVTSRDVKVEVTVNGSGFDTPSQTHYSNDGDIPTCNLVFPAGQNSRYKLTKKDIIRVFIGLDDIPDYPQFTGHQRDEDGFRSTEMMLVGSLNRAVEDKIFVTDYDNFDGLEIGAAIKTVFSRVSELSWMTSLVESTNPHVIVPSGLRFREGISKYDLMKRFRELATDPTDPLEIGRSTMFQHGDYFHFRKIPNPDNVTPWVSLAYGDTLLDLDPESTIRFAFNKAKVIGKDGVEGIFQNDHRLTTDGLAEADTIKNDDILNANEAYELAVAKVMANITNQLGAEALSHLLNEVMPNFSPVEITGAPFGLSDKYLIRNLNMDITEASFDVNVKLDVPVDILSDALSQLLQVSGSGSSSLAL